MKLTQAILNVARYEGKSYTGKGGRKSWSQCILWDDELAGFGVRISPKNRKTFVVSHRAGGRRRLKTLGKVGPLSLPRARALAREVLAEGEEAIAAESAASAAGGARARSLETFAHLCHAYLEHQRRGRARTWRTDRRHVHRYVLPVLGGIRLAEVAPRDAGKLRSRLVSTFPAERSMLTALFNAIFEWGQDSGAVERRRRPPDPAAGRKPRRKGRSGGGAEEQTKDESKEETVDIPIDSVRKVAREEEAREKAASVEAASSVEPTPPPRPAPAAARRARFDRLELGQPFARRLTYGAVLSVSPKELRVETGFALQLGETYRFEVLDGERRLDLDARVLACRLARTVRNRFGDLEPRYKARLEPETIHSAGAQEFWSGL